jgi:hypothetical protein
VLISAWRRGFSPGLALTGPSAAGNRTADRCLFRRHWRAAVSTIGGSTLRCQCRLCGSGQQCSSERQTGLQQHPRQRCRVHRCSLLGFQLRRQFRHCNVWRGLPPSSEGARLAHANHLEAHGMVEDQIGRNHGLRHLLEMGSTERTQWLMHMPCRFRPFELPCLLSVQSDEQHLWSLPSLPAGWALSLMS